MQNKINQSAYIQYRMQNNKARLSQKDLIHTVRISLFTMGGTDGTRWQAISFWKFDFLFYVYARICS